MQYDIFISYKRKSLATANNLYYRLTTRGYATFFDLEEMRRDNFNVQLLNYIENAKDVFVLLEEGSLDACKQGNWEEDWFCKEIEHALNTKRNIIPILIGNYKMPKQEFFPKELKELSLKNAPEFSYSYFEEYLTKLIEKGYITAEAEVKNQSTSLFKFYSNEHCQVLKDGKLVGSLEGMSDEPYYLPVSKKGDYRFKCINSITGEEQVLKEHIDIDEERLIDIHWESHKPDTKVISGDSLTVKSEKEQLEKCKDFIVDLGDDILRMIRVQGGCFNLWSYNNQIETLSDFWMSETPVTNKFYKVIEGLSYTDEDEINDLPKVFNNIEDCRNFLNKLNWLTEGLRPDETYFRFPTEVEWEYAARGGQNQDRYLYSGSNKADEVAWYFNWERKPNASHCYHPVGNKKPNSLGLYDMSGNIEELTIQREFIDLLLNDDEYFNNVSKRDYFIRFPAFYYFACRGGNCYSDKHNCLIKSSRNSNLFLDDLAHELGFGIRLVLSNNNLNPQFLDESLL